MTRRLILVLTLVVALLGTVVAQATADVEAEVGVEIRLPLPALPIGPGPLYPLDAYGPTADDNAVLRWGEQALASIRALRTGPTINARALAIVHTAMYDAWAAYDATAVGTRATTSTGAPSSPSPWPTPSSTPVSPPGTPSCAGTTCGRSPPSAPA